MEKVEMVYEKLLDRKIEIEDDGRYKFKPESRLDERMWSFKKGEMSAIKEMMTFIETLTNPSEPQQPT